MNSLASPPCSTDSASLASQHTNHYIDPQMRSLLASTWQVLDQPPPPSLREILAAYKSRGDGDREMLLAMLNAKSAEDQRLASIASLHRTMLEVRQTSEPSPPPLAQLPLPNDVQYSVSPTQYQHAPTPYSPPPPHTSPHQTMFAHPHSQGSPALLSSNVVVLPSMRGRTASTSNRASGSAETRRKRARHSQSPHPHSHSHSHSHPHSAHQTHQTLYPESHQSSSAHDFPPSPYSSASQASISSEGSSRTHHRERGAMAIGSLLSNASTAKAKDVDREDWNMDREQQQRRPGRDESLRVSKASSSRHSS